MTKNRFSKLKKLEWKINKVLKKTDHSISIRSYEGNSIEIFIIKRNIQTQTFDILEYYNNLEINTLTRYIKYKILIAYLYAKYKFK